MLLLDILNFYERMAISMRRHVLDEDMLYDDKGAVFLSLYGWVFPLIKDLQTRYDARAFANVCAIAAQWGEIRQSRRRAQETRAAATARKGSSKARPFLVRNSASLPGPRPCALRIRLSCKIAPPPRWAPDPKRACRVVGEFGPPTRSKTIRNFVWCYYPLKWNFVWLQIPLKRNFVWCICPQFVTSRGVIWGQDATL